MPKNLPRSKNDGNNFKFILIVSFFLFASNVDAQRSFMKGFLVNNLNDTIHGKINNYGSHQKRSKYCLFKDSLTKKIVKYEPSDIKMYSVSNRRFISLNVGSEKKRELKFIETLIDGKVCLYMNPADKKKAFYIQKADSSAALLENNKVKLSSKYDDYYFKTYRHFENYTYKNEYKKTLVSFFYDSKKTKKQIDGLEYNRKDLTDITKGYLLEVYPQGKNIFFESGASNSNVKFGVLAGIELNRITFYPNKVFPISTSSFDSDIVTIFPVGVFFNIPLYSLNERFSLQIESVFRSMKYEQSFQRELLSSLDMKINSSIIGIPISIKYNYPGVKTSPFISIGKEVNFILNSKVKIDNYTNLKLYKTQKGDYFLTLGLDYKISQKIALSAYLKYRAYKNLVVQSNLSKQSGLNTSAGIVEMKTKSSEFLLGINF